MIKNKSMPGQNQIYIFYEPKESIQNFWQLEYINENQKSA